MQTFNDFAATLTRWRSWMLMARQDINLRYKRSLLGPFWISAAMGATALGVGLLYAEVFQHPLGDYIQYLTVGLMSWNFISGLVKDSDGIVIEAAGHLRSVGIPIPVLAMRMVLRNLIVLAHNFLVVIAIFLFSGGTFTWTALLAIPGVLTVGLIGYFLSIILGPLCARYRDIPQSINSIMQLAFLMTPVFWQTTRVADRTFFIDGNPFYHMMQIIRAPILGEPATTMNWIVALALMISFAIIAAATLPATRGRVALWI